MGTGLGDHSYCFDMMLGQNVHSSHSYERNTHSTTGLFGFKSGKERAENCPPPLPTIITHTHTEFCPSFILVSGELVVIVWLLLAAG